MLPESSIQRQAEIFSVLGDRTRLRLVTSLMEGQIRSISDLSSDFEVSRQAVTKHLKLLQSVGVLIDEKAGRETRYRLNVEPLIETREMIESIENQWAQNLGRLKSFVENESP